LTDIFDSISAENCKIKSECGARELDSVLRDTEAELQKAQVRIVAKLKMPPFYHLKLLQDLKGELDSSSVLFKRYSTQLSQQDPCCPLCHRDFDSKKQSMKLVEEVTGPFNPIISHH
jgi:hypothetical protein